MSFCRFQSLDRKSTHNIYVIERNYIFGYLKQNFEEVTDKKWEDYIFIYNGIKLNDKSPITHDGTDDVLFTYIKK